MKIDVDALPVRDNRAASRFEIEYDGQVAFLIYVRRGGLIFYPHTEVPESLEGHGLAGRLARHALDYARARSLAVVPRCPYVRHYIDEHPEYADIVQGDTL